MFIKEFKSWVFTFLILMAAFAFTAHEAKAATATYYSTGPVTLSSFDGSSIINVPIGKTITDVTVSINATTPDLNVLEFHVLEPSNTLWVTLSNAYDLVVGANFTQTEFNDISGADIVSASAPYTGTFKSRGCSAGGSCLDTEFDGLSTSGNWSLYAADASGGNADLTIDSWSITFTFANNIVADDGIFMAYEDVTTTGTLTGSDSDGDAFTYSLVGADGGATKGSVVIDDADTGAFTYTPDPDANGADSFTFITNDGFEDSTAATISVTIRAVDEVQVGAGSASTVVIKDDGTLWATGWGSYGQQGDNEMTVNTVLTQIWDGAGGAIDDDWAVLSAGVYHNLALKTDGTLWAWGRNNYNQLGTAGGSSCGGFNCSLVPIQVGTDKDWALIDGGRDHSAAIKSDGSLWTWGDDANGQLGNGAGGAQSIPTKVSSATWQDLSAGRSHNLAIKGDGTLWSWGYDGYGQLGDGTIGTPLANPDVAQVGSLTNWVSVSAGYFHSTAINSDGKIYTWGVDEYGQLGDGTIGTPLANPDVAQVGSLTDWVSIVTTASSYHTMAINSSGELYSWGNNDFSQLGHSDTTTTATVTKVGTDTDWAYVATGNYHTVGVKNDGTVLVWGWNSTGQLGVVTSETCSGQPCSATPVNPLKPTADDGIFMAYEDVTTTGTLTGSDPDGDAITYIKLTDPANGTVTITDSTTGAFTYTPTVADFNGADSFTFKVNDGTVDSATATVSMTIRAVEEVQAAAGATHTVVIKDDGSMWATGYGLFGQQGDGVAANNAVLTRIGSDNDWAVIRAGRLYNFALKTDGTLWAWGLNRENQLGTATAGNPCNFGTTSCSLVPIQVGTDKDWALIDAGSDRSAAIKSDGSLWTWGDDLYGQLGNGAGVTNAATPTRVSTDIWYDLSAGYFHNLAIKADGTLWSWGRDTYGQLGDGTEDDGDVHSITQVSSLTNWASVSAGQFHSTAINSDGKIYSWGYDLYGQLGDGTIGTPDANPDIAQVGSLTDWVSIVTSGSSHHTMAINSSGELYSWGRNAYGQLGHSGTTHTATVTQVGTDTDWAYVSPGSGHTVGVKNDGTVLVWGLNNFGQLGVDTGAETCGGQLCSATPVAPLPTAPTANDSIFMAYEDVVTTGTLTGSDLNNDSITYIIVSQPTAGQGSVSITDSTTGEFTYTPTADFNGATSFTFKTNDGTLDSTTATISVTINAVEEVMAVAGELFTVVLSNGEVWSTGRNDFGQLGDGTTTDKSIFTQESTGATDWAYIAPGFHHTLAIKTDGTLWSWGIDADFGSLGIGASLPDDCGGTSCSKNPVQVGTDNDWAFIEGGNVTSAAIKSDGSLYLWGYDNESIMADGNVAANHVLTPTEITGGGSWKSIDLSWLHAIAVKTDGTLWSWGTQDNNQLGTASFESCVFNSCNTSPVQLGAATNWVSVDSGSYTSYALNSAGEIWGWGTDGAGEQASGGFGANVTTPTKIGAATNWTSISAERNIWAINSNGELYRWGNNLYGGLGDGTTTHSPDVTQFGTDTDWASVYAGQWQTIAIKNDGTMYVMGANNFGQLGVTSADMCGVIACSKTPLLVSLNTAPTTTGFTVNPVEDTDFTTGSLTSNANDVDGNPLTYSLVADNTTNGTLSLSTDGSFTFNSLTSNYNGSAGTFTFKVNDGTVDSNTSTVTLTINAVNDAPTANAGGLTATEDVTKTGTLTGGDVDGDSYTFVLVSDLPLGEGVVTITDSSTGAYSFTPASNWNGVTTFFTFKTNDGLVDSTTATLTITVNAVNDAPTANAGTLTADEDVTKTGTLTGSDTVEGSAVTYILVSGTTAQGGTVSITNSTNGAYTYTSASNYNGSDSFTFKVNDGTDDSVAKTITVTVNAVNDIPVANAGTLTASEDVTKTGTLTGSDTVEGSAVTYILVSGTTAQGGTVSITNSTNGAYSYTSASNYNGSDSFTFKVNDGTDDSVAKTITVTVNAVNDIPVANAGTLTASEDVTKTGTLTGSDTVEGSAVTFIKVSGPANGTVTITDSSTGAYTYTSNTNYNGSDSFNFKVNDGTDDSVAKTITVTVNGVNDAPVANAGTLTADEDVTTGGTLTGSDIDNDDITFIKVSGPANGTVTITDSSTGAYTYTSDLNYNGSDSFTFKVNDGTADSATTATVNVTVNAVNDVPVPTAADINTVKNFSGYTVVSHNDPDVGDSHTFTVTTDGANGSAAVDGSGNVTYTPNTDFFGVDSFVVTVTDSSLAAADVTISVSVASSDSTAPTDGVLNGLPGNSSVSLAWSGFSDDLSGIASFDIVVGTSNDIPATCNDGVNIYSGSAASYIASGVNGETYNYRICATDGHGNRSDGVTATALVPVGPGSTGLSMPGYDTGLLGLQRSDGGSDNTNKDTSTGNPIVDVVYNFATVVTDLTGTTPQSIEVYISSDGGANYHITTLTCESSNYAAGVVCSTPLVLGPAASYEFYFKTTLGDGTIIIDNNGSANYTGPTVELLTGYTMLGIPRDIDAALMDGDSAFGDPSVYRWVSNGLNLDEVSIGSRTYKVGQEQNGEFVQVAAGVDPVKSTEGYFVWKNIDGLNDRISALGAYSELAGATYTIDLQPGWNIISTPYGKHTLLSELEIQRGSDAPKTWDAATSAGYIVGGLYYYNGSDWGSTYSYIATPVGKLSPWLGYWLYVTKDDTQYKLIINKP